MNKVLPNAVGGGVNRFAMGGFLEEARCELFLRHT